MSTADPTARAHVVYLALVAAGVTMLLVLVGLRQFGAAAALAPPPGLTNVLRGVLLVLAVGGTIGLRGLRVRLPALRSGESRAAWWDANVARAVPLWALPEGFASVGAVFFFLTGDVLVLVLAAGWAAAMFIQYAPGRLTDG